MSFLEYCQNQMIGGNDLTNFRNWLGSKANENRSSNEWLRLWNKFIIKTRNK